MNPILKAVDYDVEHTVFSFIPNTAEVAFYGLLEGFDNYLNELKVKKIEALGHHPNHEELEKSCPGVSVAKSGHQGYQAAYLYRRRQQPE